MAPYSTSRPDIYRQVTDRIVAALEAGVAPWVCPWDRSGGQPHNGASGHVYRGINVVLTTMSGFADARWYTYRQAAALGGQVRRGERGTTVIYWQFIEKRAGDNNGETDGADERDGGGTVNRTRCIPILKSYVVFNHEQIAWPPKPSSEGEPAKPTIENVEPGFENVRALVTSTGAVIRHAGVRAYYAPSDDRITLPEPGRFKSPADYWSTALHELTHWTGHESRLARQLGLRFGQEAYAAEELVAELGAAFLCAELGVEGRLRHEEYIGDWIRVLRGDKRAVFTAARLAQEATAYITRTMGQEHGEGEQEAA